MSTRVDRVNPSAPSDRQEAHYQPVLMRGLSHCQHLVRMTTMVWAHLAADSQWQSAVGEQLFESPSHSTPLTRTCICCRRLRAAPRRPGRSSCTCTARPYCWFARSQSFHLPAPRCVEAGFIQRANTWYEAVHDGLVRTPRPPTARVLFILSSLCQSAPEGLL
jgi:hypothetical protein